eukprot:CAMPEP_0197073336 /NCGR_PEP_ID=MMETSP1384-20130603/210555_1 /TAXON_ID=29189 /ORGANISM="Ammonia sp." /LENGTH=539 /DNA_ID=CAMNT_0042512173 /DNA_START=17 /DNA_END=1636 /DNA_ORIENTATION=+
MATNASTVGVYKVHARPKHDTDNDRPKVMTKKQNSFANFVLDTSEPQTTKKDVSNGAKASTLSVPTADPSMGGLSRQQSSFYRFDLPAPAVEFSSEHGIQIFTEALQEGHMKGYFALAEQFRTQPETTYCGLASLTMVLNALEVDPKKTWKGKYRWFDEDMLDCSVSKDEIQSNGMTLDQCVSIARCNGLKVQCNRPEKKYVNANTKVMVKQYTTALLKQLEQEDGADEKEKGGVLSPTNREYRSLQEFRDDVVLACVTANAPQIILCYSRLGVGQVGTGHFSPVGGYNQKRDMVLILDVARFKYAPHWVPLRTLYNAMCMTDSDNKSRTRGWMMCSVENSAKSFFFSINVRDLHVADAMELQQYTTRTVRGANYHDEKAQADDCTVAHQTASQLISCLLLTSLPSPIDKYLQNYSDMFGIQLTESHETLKQAILTGIQNTGMYKLVTDLFVNGDQCVTGLKIKSDDDIKIEVVTLMLLVFGNDTWQNIPGHANVQKLQGELAELSRIDEEKYYECHHEVVCLRKQLANLDALIASYFD